MGTRGAWGFVLDGQEKITYNHCDSYPSGLGDDVLRWLRDALGLPATLEEYLPLDDAGGGQPKPDPDAEQRLREQVAALRLVAEGDTPPPEEVERLAHLWERVGSGSARSNTPDDWYALLRGAQGDPSKTLEAGVCTDGHAFPLDSLVCEWAYVVDLDARVLEVYKGFRTTPPTEGRWVGQPGLRARHDKYFPVQRVGAYPFDELPRPEGLADKH